MDDTQLGIRFVSNGSRASEGFLMRVLVALLGLLGTVFSFQSATAPVFLADVPALALCCTVSFALFSFVCCFKGRVFNLVSGFIIGGVLLYAVVRIEKVMTGFTGLAAKYNEYLTYAEPAASSAHINEALCFTAVLMSFIICYGVIRYPIFLFVFVPTLLISETYLYFGLRPDIVPFGAMVMCWAGTLCLEVAERHMDDKALESANFRRASSQGAVAATLAMLLCLSGGGLYYATVGRSEKADELRDRFNNYMQDFTWDGFREDLRDALFSSKGSSLTHDGKLGGNAEISFDGHTVLEITVPADSTDVYLKGYTANHYTGTRWEDRMSEAQIATKLTSADFFAARMLKYYPGFADLEAEYAVVRNMDSRSREKYLPYHAAGLTESDGIRRKYWLYQPQGNYMKTVIRNSPIDVDEDMAADEQVLRTQAYTECLDVSDSFRKIADEFFADYSGEDIYDEMVYIRTKLGEDNEYSLESGRMPFGADFAQWFLTENKKGSCTHFATAAVLLFRSRGVPARYCEGYLAANSDIRSVSAVNGYVTLSVPDSRAHAWAEVYIDGYGWMIFESTPGYGNIAFEYDEEENLVTSEITAVTTQDTSYSEDMQTSQVPEETVTAAPETSAEEQAPDTQGTTLAEGHEEEDGETPVTTAPVTQPPVDEGGSEGQGTGGTVPPDEVPGEGDAPDRGETSYTTASGDAPRTEEPGFFERHSSDIRRILKAVLKVFCVIAAIGAVCLVYVIIRTVIFRKRETLVRNAPDTAARKIYSMLAVLCARMGADIRETDDKTVDVIAEHFDREDALVVTDTAMRATFDTGVTADEVKRAAKAYRRMALSYISKDKKYRFIMWFGLRDRYLNEGKKRRTVKNERGKTAGQTGGNHDKGTQD